MLIRGSDYANIEVPCVLGYYSDYEMILYIIIQTEIMLQELMVGELILCFLSIFDFLSTLSCTFDI